MKLIAITGALGYIGSALIEHLRTRADLSLYAIDTCSGGMPYQELAAWNSSEVIVHLAAHASVQACEADRPGAWANNVTGFAQLLLKLRPDQRLIYASSGSVYHGLGGVSGERALLAPPRALYDLTKRTMDDLAALSGLDCYGLRFGTVCGLSPVMRNDLIINAMVKSAQERGVVNVQNPTAHRSMLALDDCVRAIERIIDYPDRAPGVYNLASFNSSIFEIGREVAEHTGAQLRLNVERTPCYDFAMQNQRAVETFGITYRGSVTRVCASLMEGVAV